jgi:hypothetical protein
MILAKKLLLLILSVLSAITLIFTSIVCYDLIRYSIGTYKVELAPITGYAPRYSFARGEPIPLYIHSTEAAHLTLFRLQDDWKPVGPSVKVAPQTQDNTYHLRKGLNWKTSLSVDSTGLSPGLYRFVLRQDNKPENEFSIPIIIKTDNPEPISIVLSTNTWDAYSVFANVSHYENNLMHFPTKYILDRFSGIVWQRGPQWRMSIVPTHRPKSLFSEEMKAGFGDKHYTYMIAHELKFLIFMANNGLSYSVYSDADFENDTSVRRSKLIVFPGHTEYWSDGMFYALERFLAQGGKMFATMGGLEKQVSLTPDSLRFGKTVPREVVRGLFGTSPDEKGFLSAAPFRVTCADSWVFGSTSLASGDVFGSESSTIPSLQLPGHAYLKGQVDLDTMPTNGASGFLTSKVGAGSGAFALLAVGMNPDGPAHMVYRDLPAGGWVFNASSGTFNGALASDAAIAQLTRTLLMDATADRSATRREPRCD